VTDVIDQTVQVTIDATAADSVTVTLSLSKALIAFGEHVTLTALSTGGTPPMHYQFFINGAALSPPSLSATAIYKPAAEGTYQINVTATDYLGNTGTSSSHTLTVTGPNPDGYTGFPWFIIVVAGVAIVAGYYLLKS
jgi:hypothetical protein